MKKCIRCKTVATRIDGVLNDVHTMNKRAEEAYKQNLEATADNAMDHHKCTRRGLTPDCHCCLLNIGLTRSIVTPIKSLSYRAKQKQKATLLSSEWTFSVRMKSAA
ncbi:hypothetical protein ACEQPO_09015 [Bacillus sp. SL00103]